MRKFKVKQFVARYEEAAENAAQATKKDGNDKLSGKKRKKA